MKHSAATVPEYRTVVSIIPGGTMQFLDLAFDLRRIPRSKTAFIELESPSTSDDKVNLLLKCLRQSDDGSEYLDLQTGEPLVNPRTGEPDRSLQPDYSISPEKALEPFLDKWVPLPFFRTEGTMAGFETRYRNGPTDWCRARVVPLPQGERSGNTHRLVIAFDTHTQEDIDVTAATVEEGYGSLSAMDMEHGAEFALATQFKSYAWFLGLYWMRDWLRDLFHESLRRKTAGRSFAKEPELEHRYEHLARYIAFVELLGSLDPGIPRVKLTDPRRHSTPIDVDLVLDIGNSRTIGMLIEKRPGESLSLDNGSVLSLRDLTRPAHHHREPFSSHVCFSVPRFGDPQGYARGAGRYRPSFSWPSVVRVGPEAQRLAMSSRCEEGQTSMSSPKRYLWDLKPRVQEWRFAPDPEDPTSTEAPVNSGEFVGYVNNEGTPLHAFESKVARGLDFFRSQSDFPVTEPRFSRSSMMMFLLSEILAHALVQVNSPAQRNNRPNPDIPRRLRRIILTTPPAMSVSERKLYQMWASWAIDVVWKALDWDAFAKSEDDYRKKPQLRMDLDEATATQLVFVYNEVEKRFSGDSALYFDIFGKKRAKYGNQRTLRIASIDIGGGTTDMVVTTYLAESAGATNILVPHQEYREGFNVAGDEVMKAVIEGHLIPELLRFLSAHDNTITRETLMRRLGRDAVDLTEKDRNLRAQFAQQVLIPIALRLLSEMEEIPAENLSSLSSFQLSVKALLDEGRSVVEEVLTFINNLVSSGNGQDFRFLEWTPTFDLAAVGTSITAAIGPYLTNLAEIAKLWGCDWLVLSGRPSRLPVIRSIFLKAPPVEPSRVVAMSEYQVESWYPFWTTASGRIDDPKTTGVVGALLFTVSEGNLQNFHIRTEKLKPASTIKYIGTMGVDMQIRDRFLLFDGADVSQIRDEELTCSVPFQTQTFIGFRQMKAERWKTTPFYQLSFTDQVAAERGSRSGPYQVTLSYRRIFEEAEDGQEVEGENEGVLRIEEVIDRHGSAVARSDLSLSLKSIWDDSHWIDTGLFQVN